MDRAGPVRFCSLTTVKSQAWYGTVVESTLPRSLRMTEATWTLRVYGTRVPSSAAVVVASGGIGLPEVSTRLRRATA